MQKILITGISGMLGSVIYKKLSFSNNLEIYGANRSRVFKGVPTDHMLGDLSDVESFKEFSSVDFDVVIHCAAEVNLQKCEDDVAWAEKMNVISTDNLIRLLKYKEFIYVSTDSVFDGNHGMYNENDTPNALNAYAISKLKSEKLILDKLDRFIILRTNIYGFSSPMKSSLFEWGFSALKSGKSICGYNNFIFNPVYTGQFATVIQIIIKKLSKIDSGIYHLAVDDMVSKYDFLTKIAVCFEFDETKIDSVYYIPKDGEIQRPINTTLDNSLIKRVLNIELSLEDGLLQLREDLTNI